MRPNTSPSRTHAGRLLPLGVLIVLVAAALGTFFVTRRVVDDQEHRLLKERTAEVVALLSNSTTSIQSSLQVLGALGSVPDPSSGRLFEQSAGPLIKGSTVAEGVATGGDPGFTVAAAVGDGPPAGTPLTGDRAALAVRAVTAGKMVSALIDDPKGKRLILALPAAGAGKAVSYQESVLDPATPAPQTPDSPFRELRIALYAADKFDPSHLILTTEARVPLTGQVQRVPIPIGAESWFLAVAARDPLVGSFTRRAPWFLLGGGLLAALLGTAVALTLSRRRAYALTLVAERTCELDETRAFLEELVTAAPVAVLRVTVPERDVSYVSPNVERLFGVTEQQARAPGSVGGSVHPEDRPGYDAAYGLVADGTTRRQAIEYRLHVHDTYRWVSAVLVPETDDNGTIVAVLAYVLDVHDRRHAEQAQREAQEAADGANRSKSEFLSRMSHELRTPLNAVLGFGQLLELDVLTDDQAESVGQILKGGRHLLGLIDEVLDISRIETGELALSREALLTAAVVHEAVDLLRPIAEERNIQVVVDRSGVCDCYLFADHQRTKQILLNLLSNAVKYNRPRGTVAVTCGSDDPLHVRITVTDTGPGIPKERIEHLFIPFERLGAEDTDVEGTGIGLALSRRLAQAMDGTLTVTSTLGHGSTFTLELPRTEGPVDRYERLVHDTEAVAPAPERHKVLHIEDNLSNVKLVERILARRPDVEIIPAMHGRLGLELAHEHHPILVLLDLHLPDMNGEEVLQRLRDDPVTASIPVVIVSADATVGRIGRLLSAGATAYLSKPIEVNELLRYVDEALETASRSGAAGGRLPDDGPAAPDPES